MLRSSLLLCAAAWLLALMLAAPVHPRTGPPAALAPASASLAGQFLVATEQLNDPRFVRTVIYLARHDGQQQVRLASDIGRRLPAVVTSLGKAMLASLPDDELEQRLSGLGTMPRPTRRSHRTIDDLRRDLHAIRERGFAVDEEENTIGVTCFGVALATDDQPTAVSTTLLSQRATPELRGQLISDLRLAAAQLSPFARV